MMVELLTGVLVTSFAFCLFGSQQNKDDLETDDKIEIVEITGRHVTLSCQTCRKLKRHREVESNLFECTKCRRHIDLR
ncbi:hypothetical protein ACQCU1_03510 [Sutcliffiella horikoshii]|uniref:hypothetical protein n=1 Tax=Sutcliffiella horikoshii TaxID=79883 RepID=UPI003CFBAF07